MDTIEFDRKLAELQAEARRHVEAAAGPERAQWIKVHDHFQSARAALRGLMPPEIRASIGVLHSS